MGNPYETATERRSILGPTIQFDGELSADEELVILGKINGSISHSQRLIVGPGGKVTASINAQSVIIEGSVEGDVRASGSVVVKEAAQVRGNLTSPSVSILPGATFNGGIDMDGGKTMKSDVGAPAAAHSAA